MFISQDKEEEARADAARGDAAAELRRRHGAVSAVDAGLNKDKDGDGVAAASQPGQLPKRKLHRDEVPVHLRFNKYVLSHYRPATDWKGCLASLFYFHNETINILTHAIPIFVIAFSIPQMLPWHEINVPYLPYVHIVAFMSPWVGSTLYHLFMSHWWGYVAYKTLLTLDVLGIWIAQCCGSLVTIFATTHCFDDQVHMFIMLAYGLSSLQSFYMAATAVCPWKRRYSFLPPLIFRLVMLALRSMDVGGGHEEAMNHLVIQDVLAIFGAFIGAANIPERWFPGKLDLFFNSHNFMHVIVVVAAYQMHLAVSLDLVWMTQMGADGQSCTALPAAPLNATA